MRVAYYGERAPAARRRASRTGGVEVPGMVREEAAMAGRWPILALMLALLVVTSWVVPAGAMARAPIAAAAAAPLAQGRDSVKYGYVAILPNAPMFIAVERGYFGDQGLDVEMVPFDSGALR